VLWEKEACHSTRPFESLRVLSQVEGLMALSPSAVSSGPNGKIEGLVFGMMPSRLDFEIHPVNPVILSKRNLSVPSGSSERSERAR
jgi:hypothetical protein